MGPSPLADAGFRVAGMEVPVGIGAEKVVVDVVLLHEGSALFVACEAKSGRNVEERQARKYTTLDPVALTQATSVDLAGRTRPRVAALYVCLGENVSRIQQGLTAAGMQVPVLAIDPTSAMLRNREVGPGELAVAFPDSHVDLPFGVPRIVPCDDQSTEEMVRPQVEAVLVAHLSRRSEQVATAVLANETLTHLPIYGKAARQRFQRTVDDSARAIAAAHPATYEFTGSTGTREAQVRFLSTPEDNDPRGRTQAYQALARTGHTRRRRPAWTDPDQLDLLAEIDGTDDQPEDESEEAAT